MISRQRRLLPTISNSSFHACWLQEHGAAHVVAQAHVDQLVSVDRGHEPQEPAALDKLRIGKQVTDVQHDKFPAQVH